MMRIREYRTDTNVKQCLIQNCNRGNSKYQDIVWANSYFTE